MVLQSERLLLILDLDETLVHASETLLESYPDFIRDPYYVYIRPGLESFLKTCAGFCDLAIWSTGTEDYVEALVSHIVPEEIQLQFVWSRLNCTYHRNRETLTEYFLKDLRKIRRRGRSLDRVLIVDDEPLMLGRSYGNAIYVNSFYGSKEDSEFDLLGVYLKTLDACRDVRMVEKRSWRQKARAVLEQGLQQPLL